MHKGVTRNNNGWIPRSDAQRCDAQQMSRSGTPRVAAPCGDWVSNSAKTPSMSRKRVTLPQPAGQVLGRLASHCPQGAVYASPCKYCSGLHQAYRFSAIPRTPLRYQLRPMRSEQWRRSGSSSDWRDLQSDLSDRAGNPVLLMPAPDSNRRMAPSKGACTGPDATRSSCRHGCRLSPSAASAAIGSEWGDGPSGSWAPFPWTALPRPGPLRSDGAAPWIPDERTLSGKGPLGGLQSPKEQGEFQGLCRGA
jgi:hypothetical protein